MTFLTDHIEEQTTSTRTGSRSGPARRLVSGEGAARPRPSPTSGGNNLREEAEATGHLRQQKCERILTLSGFGIYHDSRLGFASFRGSPNQGARPPARESPPPSPCFV